MPKPKAMIDYSRCHPERCNAGVCAAAIECSFGVLKQDAPQEVPYAFQDFCLGCGKCWTACPFKAVKML